MHNVQFMPKAIHSTSYILLVLFDFAVLIEAESIFLNFEHFEKIALYCSFVIIPELLKISSQYSVS